MTSTFQFDRAWPLLAFVSAPLLVSVSALLLVSVSASLRVSVSASLLGSASGLWFLLPFSFLFSNNSQI